MAAYLALRDKTTGDLRMGRDLIDIDNELCAALGVQPDDDHFYRSWVDTIGFSLALGKSFEEARTQWSYDADLQRVVSYLEARYENTSYFNR